MCDLFFAYNGQNYARYLTLFSIYMLNVDGNSPRSRGNLKNRSFYKSSLFILGNKCAVDKTIGKTFMKHNKSRGNSMDEVFQVSAAIIRKLISNG